MAIELYIKTNFKTEGEIHTLRHALRARLTYIFFLTIFISVWFTVRFYNIKSTAPHCGHGQHFTIKLITYQDQTYLCQQFIHQIQNVLSQYHAVKYLISIYEYQEYFFQST